jgi:hypothetical protein|tara:strand:- start:209 stop:535 length:327 start_codon:yes stop_codon:yes gene_type:complete
MKENSSPAYELVQLCTFFDPDSIPELIFKEGHEDLGDNLKEAATDDLQWQKMIKEACRFSLLERNADKESFRMRRLIQQAVKDSDEKPENAALKSIKALNESFPNAKF